MKRYFPTTKYDTTVQHPKIFSSELLNTDANPHSQEKQKPEDVWYFSDKYHWHIDTKVDLFDEESLNK